MNTRAEKKKPNEFEQNISPKPIPACDLLKVLLGGGWSYPQDKPYPPIEISGIAANKWEELNPLFGRTKTACKFDMVIDPMSLAVSSHTFFISKEKHEERYKEASKECDDNASIGLGFYGSKIY